MYQLTLPLPEQEQRIYFNLKRNFEVKHRVAFVRLLSGILAPHQKEWNGKKQKANHYIFHLLHRRTARSWTSPVLYAVSEL